MMHLQALLLFWFCLLCLVLGKAGRIFRCTHIIRFKTSQALMVHVHYVGTNHLVSSVIANSGAISVIRLKFQEGKRFHRKHIKATKQKC